jgi:fumarate hydratase subunit beta
VNDKVKRIEVPLTSKVIESLNCGDRVLLRGTVYTARDAAHEKMIEALNRGESLPFDLQGQVLYFVGPSPATPEQVIGSAGPTTAGRMDSYSPILLEWGLKGMIGKGDRSREVIASLVKNRAVYFGAIGGAGALLADSIVSSEVIAYPELGTEAIRRLEIKDFPAIVLIDSRGENLYVRGKKEYRRI